MQALNPADSGSLQPSQRRAGIRAIHLVFIAAFLGSCCWFWWLQSLVYRLVLVMDDPVSDATLALSFVSAGLFLAGYFLPIPIRVSSGFSKRTIDRCEKLSYAMTVALFPVALLIAIAFFISTWS